MRGLLALARVDWRVLGHARLGALFMGLFTALAQWHGDVALDEPVKELAANTLVPALFSFVFAFVLGLGRLTPELRDGTIDHLDALPVGRGPRWGVKVVVGAVLLLPLLGGTVLGAWVDAAAVEAVGFGPAHDLLAPVVNGAGSALILAYGLGLALGWLGPTAWLPVLLGLLTTLVLSFEYSPVERWVPVFPAFLRAELADDAVVASDVPWTIARIGVLLAFSSLLVYLGPASLLVRGGARVSTWLRRAALAGGCLVLLGGTALTVVGVLFTSPRLLGSTTWRTVGGFRVLTTTTSPEVETLLEALPGEADRAARRFGLAEPPSLDLELTSGSKSHAGFTTPTKIRMAATAGVPTLRHELIHAMIQARMGRSAEECDLRFLHEGLATEGERRGDTAWATATWRRAAAIERAKGAVFADVIDAGAYIEERDELALYTLSFTFSELLVRRIGDDGLVRLVDAFAVECAERSGLPLWVAATTRAGIDLPAFVGEWTEELHRVATTLPPDPHPRASLAWKRRELEVDEATAICRFRSQENDDEELVERVEPKGGRCPIPESRVQGDSVDYQLGWTLDDGLIFTPWRTLHLQ